MLYRCASGELPLFESTGSSRGTFTHGVRGGRHREATVSELRGRGVTFEDVDVPGLRTVGGIAEVTRNYPSTGSGERAAWFRDSEGNMLGIGEVIR